MSDLRKELDFYESFTGDYNGYKALVDLGNLLRANGHKIVVNSGGFDPIHGGHLKMFKESKKLGTLVVLVNCNDFLIRKKGYFALDQEERVNIVQELKSVDFALIYKDPTQYVVNGILALKPDYFCNGGDRLYECDIAPPEVEACKQVGTELKYCGGFKHNSSSAIINKLRDKLQIK